MKPFYILSLFGLTALLIAAVLSANEHFSVKEYDEFHDVLHPLEHEALPKGDFARIRSQSSALLSRGETLVKLGVPEGTKESHEAEFEKELKKFSGALEKFRADAKDGTDDSLKTSFSAVHDSFEMLAAMLPRKSR